MKSVRNFNICKDLTEKQPQTTTWKPYKRVEKGVTGIVTTGCFFDMSRI